MIRSRLHKLYEHVIHACYSRKLKAVGPLTRFGGRHITLAGGHARVGGGITLGDRCTVYDFCQLVTDDFDENCGIQIGDDCHFNYGCYLSGTGGLVIGNHCLFGPGVKIVTGGHRYDDLQRPMIEQGLTTGRVVIEDDVWVGAGAIILPHVTLGRGAIVAAGAVVTKDVAPYHMVAGIPAATIRVRGIADP